MLVLFPAPARLLCLCGGVAGIWEALVDYLAGEGVVLGLEALDEGYGAGEHCDVALTIPSTISAAVGMGLRRRRVRYGLTMGGCATPLLTVRPVY